MKKRDPRASIQLFRVASLALPPAVAWHFAFTAPAPSELVHIVSLALGGLWLLAALALVVRSVRALARDKRGPTLLDRIDVLTASGSALSWTASIAIVGAVLKGWASLAVVGILGLGILVLVVLWTTVAVGGEDPFGRASVSRRFVPETVPEGAPLIEELTLTNVRIPTGFRLFATGRIGPRWATSRYAVDDTESGGEIRMEQDVGPAIRGDHEAEPLEVWLQDVFGLCRTPRIHAGRGKVTVLPKARPIASAKPLLGEAGLDLEPKTSQKLPTEGALRLREYQPGDDARRIHWVRSLTSRELVVRLPDEAPPDRPAVRLLLDTFLPGTDAWSCVAPGELLDALVSVWLGVGQALAEKGSRVTLVTASPKEGAWATREERLTRQSMSRAERLGAEAVWQDSLPVAGLVTDEPTIIVSYRFQPDPIEGADVRWIIVPEPVWTCFEEKLDEAPPAVLAHPMGSPENRWSRRRRERARKLARLRDHHSFARACADAAPRKPGSLVARPGRDAKVRLEVVR